MKHLVFILAFFLTVINGTSQSYELNVKRFTDSFFFKVHRFNKDIIVADQLDSSAYNSIQQALEKGLFIKRTSYDNGKRIVIDSFLLTKAEKDYIDSSIKKSVNSIWTKELIGGAIILSKDVVDSIYSKHASEIDTYLWINYGDRRIFFLSKPIFLRHNTICIFSDSMDCGTLCGGGTLAIYKKKGQQWETYMMVSNWVE